MLVLEVGADRPRDIADIMKWLKPDIGVVTVMGKIPVHIDFLSLEEVKRKSHCWRQRSRARDLN